MASTTLPRMGATVKLREMVRPFTLRDFALVRRLSEHGVSLHAESALADNLHPLRGALLNMVVRGDFPTFVWRSVNRDQVGFIQLLLEDDRHHAHILYLSPTIAEDDSLMEEVPLASNHDTMADVWLPLLDQAVSEVGFYGVHSLVAEVNETGPELPLLRRAGFVVYARQDIWVLSDEVKAPPEEGWILNSLQARQTEDDWDIQLLYANTVPRLVQLVEPVPPSAKGNVWVLRDESGDLAAFIHLHEGAMATWLRFFIHPSAESYVDEIIQAAVHIKDLRLNRPVYCCVRRYEGGLPGALERSGFQSWSSQAVLVKHTVHHQQRPSPKLAIALENGGIPVSSPYVPRWEDEKETAVFWEEEVDSQAAGPKTLINSS